MSTTPITPTTATASTGTVAGNPSTQINDDTFLQLMVAQLQQQDPLNPTDTSDYLSQLAQFTSVEQETDTASSTSQLASESEATEALNLIGLTATYTDSSGATQTGEVTSVDLTGTTPTLTIGTASGISPTQVTTVS